MFYDFLCLCLASVHQPYPCKPRYQIGSNLFPDACVTHHSAFEVFGYGSQVFYECIVATDKRFSDFEKIAGFEEVIRCMMLVPGLNEQKVLECLARSSFFLKFFWSV